MCKTKVCTKCGQEKPATEEYFNKGERGLYGLRSDCRECRNIYKKKQHIKMDAIERVQRKQYYADNRERELASVKQWRIDNPEKVKARNDKWRADNPEQHKENHKKWALANMEHLRQYRKENFEHHKKVSQIWSAKNKDRTNTKEQKRRSLKRQLPSTLTTEQWGNMKQHFNNSCAYCGEEKPLEQEHFFPLIKGGEYAVSNIIPSCGSCNRSKGPKDFFIWYKSQPQYSRERELKILKYLGYDAKNKIQQLALI